MGIFSRLLEHRIHNYYQMGVRQMILYENHQMILK